ncbi:GAP1-N1 domain-containing protein [Flavobacterium collinsii]|uniref:Effector-associated domain-containing protein n=1 Tax=Flavobacterium collinsii TaxID=1114861 RepID=A0ABN7EMU0_9FLAO|nr:effector-associated domain EAD1-containing protein [Flavobacterium collinsii]CAA9200822.1 hypothetical protein FLACOL7796_03449 [Flavobacterium collinsii]
MKIVIHQSICGEVDKAWGLINTTLQDLNLAKNIAFKADLQEQTGGIVWNPAIRGFLEGDFFLVMKTFEDISNDVRRGRKFSHVLMIRKRDMLAMDDLTPIIDHLPEKMDKNLTLEIIDVEYKNKEVVDLVPSIIEGRFNKLINGYIQIKNFKNTLIWIGQENFQFAVIELWKRLTEEERVKFNFGISFNNDNKAIEGISLITVPDSVHSKFLRSDFFIIGKNDSHHPTEFLEKLLVGDLSVKKRIENFEIAIGSDVILRDDINFIAKGLDAFENLEEVSDLKKLNTLSHIVAKFAPSDRQGSDFKQKLLQKIIELVGGRNFSEIVILKNFRTESYNDSKEKLSETLSQWLRKNILSIKSSSENVNSFFGSLNSGKINWWDLLIENELELYLGKVNASNSEVIFFLIQLSADYLSRITRFIDQSKEAEISLIQLMPKKLSASIIEELTNLSLKNDWLRLYAHLLNFNRNIEQNLTKLLKLDTDINNYECIDIIIKGKRDNLIIDYAVKSGEGRLIKIAGKICRDSPKELKRLDVLNDNWQRIWLEAIDNGNAISSGLKEPLLQIHRLFDGLISDIEISEELIFKISESEYGNILDYPNKNKLWGKFAPNAKINFLTKTSAVLLQHLSLNPNTILPEDDEIIDHIGQKGVWDYLFYNRSSIKSVIPIFERFNLHDTNLKDYLNNYAGQITAVEATHLGKLIFSKRFTGSAYVINDKASKRNNWKYALAECHYLLDFITKAALVISGTISSVNIPTDQWWESTQELIIELYPNGTVLTTIWKKAGGKESDLLTRGTANEIWSDALYKIRRSHFKKTTMNKLLKEIAKQYGDNKRFKIIYDLRKNYIKT